MQTLVIKDLAIAADLDHATMASVRGGTGKPLFVMPSLDLHMNDFSFNANQLLSQGQNTVVNNGNNVAFSSGITANVSPSQHGSNNINLGGGYL